MSRMRRIHMRRINRFATAILCLAAALLSSCASGPVRRVSEPAASIQQLEVLADGRWTVTLRIENFSSVPMRFSSVAMSMKLDDETAARIDSAPELTIAPESADIALATVTPSSAARIAIADALSARRTVRYELFGSVGATPEDGRPQTYDVERRSTLSTVPGLAGTFR